MPSPDHSIAQTPPEQSFLIEGMHCGSCVSRLEEGLKKAFPQLLDVRVNLVTHKATVIGMVSPEAVMQAVQVIGYQARLIPAEDQLAATRRENKEATNRLPLIRLISGVVFTTPLFAMHMLDLHFTGIGWVQLALSTPVVFFGGSEIFQRALLQALRGQSDMNTLIALGAGVAWGYSASLLWMGQAHHQELYFETAAMIVTLILLGRYLEARATGQAGASIRALLDLQPETALKQSGADWETVPVVALNPDDVVLVRPGSQVPVDGVVLEGSSAVNEAMLTGESLPVSKTVGEVVLGGTLNKSGSLTVRVTHCGSDSTLARMITLVEQAQSGKPPVQRLADRVAGVFVPIVLLMAITTFLGWFLTGADFAYALRAAIAVLVIACPCALGLATPTAIQVGLGRAAEEGILIRDPEGLERVHQLRALVLDKTGTLTQGKPLVSSFQAMPGFEAQECLALASALERHSEHPLAQAIVSYVAAQPTLKTNAHQAFSVKNFEAHAGAGVQANIGGRQVTMGTAEALVRQGVLTAPLIREIQASAQQGQTPVLLAIEGRLAGLFTLSDTLKPNASEAIAALRGLGIKPYMLSGDKKETALFIAQQAGLTPAEVQAEVSPAQKLTFIERLQSQNYGYEQTCVVGMVGDGVNDAPALAQADVSIAMGTGTDVAMTTAQITLLNGDIGKVASAILLSRAILRTIRQNLFWAFAYNLVAIPLAALGWLSPTIAAGVMAFSSISVVLNSLRLKRFKTSV